MLARIVLALALGTAGAGAVAAPALGTAGAGAVAAPALGTAGAGAVAAPAAGSSASAYQSVLHAYQAQGAVPPCHFSPAQLQSALQGVDAYGAQYFADFTQAIQNALSERAAGACSGPASQAPAGTGSSGTGAPGAGGSGPGAPGAGGLGTGAAGAGGLGTGGRPLRSASVAANPPAPFGPVTAATGAGVPAPLALMGALAALAALCGAGILAFRTLRSRRARPPGRPNPTP